MQENRDIGGRNWVLIIDGSLGKNKDKGALPPDSPLYWALLSFICRSKNLVRGKACCDDTWYDWVLGSGYRATGS